MDISDRNFININFSWFDMDFSDFRDSIELSPDCSVFRLGIEKRTELSLEDNYENNQNNSIKNFLNLCIVSGNFGEFDRKKSQKNIEILCNVITNKSNICPLIKK